MGVCSEPDQEGVRCEPVMNTLTRIPCFRLTLRLPASHGNPFRTRFVTRLVKQMYVSNLQAVVCCALLGALAELREVAVSFVTSVHSHGTALLVQN
jgi:hypothetical protein